MRRVALIVMPMRILMRRRDIYRTGVTISADDLCNVHAVVIDRSRNQSGPGRQESLARAGIARFFHPYWDLWDPIKPVRKVARPCCDPVVTRICDGSHRTPRDCAQILRNGFAEWQISHGIAISHDAAVAACESGGPRVSTRCGWGSGRGRAG